MRWREPAGSHGHHQECLKFQQVYEQRRSARVAAAENNRYSLLPQAPGGRRHESGRDLHSGEISAALGHLSDATKSTYGHANMCKGRGVAPARVTAARPVKIRAELKRTIKK
jgi:hypothetical protein